MKYTSVLECIHINHKALLELVGSSNRSVWQRTITLACFYGPLLANIPSIQSNPRMQLRACHVLLYIEDKNWTEKVEKTEWKRKLAPLFHHKEDCLWQMGHSQSQEAINNMSTVLLTITCSIRGVFKCLDCRHNLFFVTIYCQNTRSTWECSDRCQCQAELAAWLSEFIFFSWYHFIDRSFAGMVNSLSDWQCIPGCNSVKYSRWPVYDAQDMVSVDFFPALHMQIGLCRHHCQIPVAHNEVSEELCLIFVTQRSTCTDGKHSASTWWDANRNTAALLGQVVQNVFRKQDSAQWMIKYVIHTAYLHSPLTSMPSCVSHYTSAKGSHNLGVFCCL